MCVRIVLDAALSGKDTANYTWTLFTKDGRRRDINLNATARRGPLGEIIGVIGVGQDLTELKQISAQHERLAADWQRLVETANAPIFGVNADGNVNEWNSKAAEISGFSKEETMGRPLVRDFINPEHRERVQAVLIEALNGDETANFELPLDTKSGQRLCILLNATTRRDENGDVVGMLGVGQDITNLRAALTDNQRIADDLTRLIDTANAPIFGIDPGGCVNEWNQKAAEISGYTKSESYGKDFVDLFVCSEFRAEIHQVLTEALDGVYTANFTFPLHTKDGSRREISLNATARRGTTGEVNGVIGVGQDMTDFERSRAEQRTIAEDLQRLIESANAPIIGVDVEGNVTEWNTKAVKLTGFSREEVLGHHLVNEFITPEYVPKVRDVLTQACNGVDTANFEVPLITKDGKRVDMLLNATARLDANGSVTGVVMVGQDITRLREAVNEVESAAGDLERLIDTANAPIFGVNTHGRITQWNQKTATITGFRREEAEGKPFVDEFILPEFREEVRRVIDMALSGHDTANYEVTIVTKDGYRRFILLNATTRRNADGDITGVISVGQDISDLKKLMLEHQRVADDWARLIETANAPIFGVNVDLKVTIWNRIAAELSGYSKDEALGLPLVEHFITEEYKVQVAQVLSLACQGTDTSNFEFPLLTKDGKQIVTRWRILLNATPRRDADTKVEGVLGVGQNITALRESTYQAKVVADDLARLIDGANAPIFGIDARGSVVEWNRMFFKITGYDKASVLGKPLVQSFIHLDQQKKVHEVFQSALAGEDVENFELQLYTNKGNCRVLSINATRRIGSNGEITGVIGVGQDITEINIQRKELERVAGNLRRIVDFANAPIIGVNVQCSVNEFNHKAAEISGWTKEEMLGQSLVQTLVPAVKRPTVAFVLLQALSGQDAADFEFPLLTRAGEQRQVTMNFTALRGVDDDVEGVICVGIDITDMRKMAQEQRNIAEDFERVIRSANAPIIGANINGEVTDWNDKAASLSGFSREEAMGKPLVETFVREDMRPLVNEAIHKACQGIETTSFEFPLILQRSQRSHYAPQCCHSHRCKWRNSGHGQRRAGLHGPAAGHERDRSESRRDGVRGRGSARAHRSRQCTDPGDRHARARHGVEPEAGRNLPVFQGRDDGQTSR
ncbi:unnamed protein product [Prorocentrum cordatum]|uniref:histidine kinase n=1 Tax=Prorocentrum cordatum TaxID=2364126 RepID=A0ABN9VAC2_9DINO|nr:unnamed protein product [Polarella glacialis]